MGLKALLSSLDEATEETRSLYSEQKAGDKTIYVLDVEDIDNHPKVRGVITANRNNAAKRDEYKAKVAELEAKIAEIPEGFDPEEYLTLKAAAGDPDDPNKKKIADEHIQSQKALYETRIANLTKKHAEELAARDEALAERDGYIDRTTKLDVLRKSLRDVGVDSDFEDVVVDHLSPSIKVQRTDEGRRTAFVETDLGEVDVPSFVKEWAASKGQKFLGKPSGPGAEGNNGGGRGGIKVPAGDFGGDRDARTKAIASKFPELAGN